MKKLPLLVFFIIFTGLVSCREEEFDQNNPSVDQFVHLLVEGEYQEFVAIPNFRPEQIPSLLLYADDTTSILYFPANPIASFHMDDFKLGECMLWTIESIRVSYGQVDSHTSIERYPSLFPVLINEASQRPDRRATDAEIHHGYQAYYNWWYDDPNETFEQKRTINPLEDTPLNWR
uniref:DUF4943 family protein n=1 Tax=Roseihalotalea indica TaxID=2867963 RepID=A0AA49JCP3_9BACT|nr:DUF4943 family protein [Tunicatimonas sp. TK19036]